MSAGRGEQVIEDECYAVRFVLHGVLLRLWQSFWHVGTEMTAAANAPKNEKSQSVYACPGSLLMLPNVSKWTCSTRQLVYLFETAGEMQSKATAG